MSALGVRVVISLVFLAAECPVAELYAASLSEMARELESSGVVFFGIASNRRDTTTALARFAASHDLRFPPLRDIDGEASAQLGVRRTPQAVMLADQDLTRRWAGGPCFAGPPVLTPICRSFWPVRSERCGCRPLRCAAHAGPRSPLSDIGQAFQPDRLTPSGWKA